MFLCFDDVVNIMLAFLTNNAHYSAIFQIFDFFDSDQENYSIFVTCTKNETICETESINMFI